MKNDKRTQATALRLLLMSPILCLALLAPTLCLAAPEADTQTTSGSYYQSEEWKKLSEGRSQEELGRMVICHETGNMCEKSDASTETGKPAKELTTQEQSISMEDIQNYVETEAFKKQVEEVLSGKSEKDAIAFLNTIKEQQQALADPSSNHQGGYGIQPADSMFSNSAHLRDAMEKLRDNPQLQQLLQDLSVQFDGKSSKADSEPDYERTLGTMGSYQWQPSDKTSPEQP